MAGVDHVILFERFKGTLVAGESLALPLHGNGAVKTAVAELIENVLVNPWDTAVLV